VINYNRIVNKLVPFKDYLHSATTLEEEPKILFPPQN